MEDRVVATLEPTQTVEALPGDTPFRLLMRAGVTPDDAQAAIRTLSNVWDPRGLRAGQKAAVFVLSDRLLSVRLPLAPGRDVVVTRRYRQFRRRGPGASDSLVASLGTGTIWTSLSEAAGRASVPMSVVSEMIRTFTTMSTFSVRFIPAIRSARYTSASMMSPAKRAGSGGSSTARCFERYAVAALPLHDAEW